MSGYKIIYCSSLALGLYIHKFVAFLNSLAASRSSVVGLAVFLMELFLSDGDACSFAAAVDGDKTVIPLSFDAGGLRAWCWTPSIIYPEWEKIELANERKTRALRAAAVRKKSTSDCGDTDC